MQQKHAHIDSIQNNEDPSDTVRIGSVFISDEYENGQVILNFENRGKNVVSIYISYEEFNSPGKKLRESFDLSNQTPKKVRLSHGFDRWKKLYFKVGDEERHYVNESLKKLLDVARRKETEESSLPETKLSTVEPEQSSNQPIVVNNEDTENTDETSFKKDDSIDYQGEAEKIVRSAHERVKDLADAYRNGEPIDLDDLQVPTPNQKVLLFLNSMGRGISEWITELEQSGEVNRNLIDTLRYRKEDIKNKLKELRRDSPPVPKPLELETYINTNTELEEIKKKCEYHIIRFEGRLIGYEEGREVDDLAAYDEFIPQFIKDRLFNGVARFVPFDQFPEQMDAFLALVGYEVVPIEIGKTKVDACVHDIQGSRQTGDEPGTIVDVILPGLRQTTDGEIIQKPVVIRGE